MPAAKKEEKIDASTAIKAFLSITSSSNGKTCNCVSYRAIKKIAIKYPEILAKLQEDMVGRPIAEYAGKANVPSCNHIDDLIEFGQKQGAMQYMIELGLYTTWPEARKAVEKRENQLKNRSTKKKSRSRKLQVD